MRNDATTLTMAEDVLGVKERLCMADLARKNEASPYNAV
jgi:hypothetical protein